MPVQARVVQDIDKIKKLALITKNRVKLIRVSGNPYNFIELELNYPSYSLNNSTLLKQDVSKIHIDFLDNYPLSQPKIKFLTPIFHPNVFPNGILCIGSNWNPTEFLDLLIKRVIRIICFDAQYTNPNSPANSSAATWYKRNIISNPSLFPTEDLSKAFPDEILTPKISFRNLS